MSRLWAVLAFFATLAFVASPWLAPGFNGFEPTQFPVPQDKPPVQPAGYAFAIWGLIYLLLLAGTGFGLFKRAQDEDWQPMRPPLVLSMALGAAWLPLAQVAPVPATVLIWAMLAAALWSLFRVGVTDRWLQQTPVALYAGWLTAASCVALGLMLAGYGWLPETLAALVSLSLALAIALTVQYRLHRAPEYGLTVIWALIGVIVANWQPLNIAVAGLALIGIAAILALRGTDTE